MYETSNNRTLVIVDDDPLVLQSLEVMLRSWGYKSVICFEDPLAFREWIKNYSPRLVLLDLIFPQASGEDILSDLVRDHPQTTVLILSSLVQIETAVRCVKEGAFDYLTKPLDKNKLKGLLQQLLPPESADLPEIDSNLAQRLGIRHPEYFSGIISNNPKILALFRYVEAVGSSNHTVLITGETGVGKELFAQAVHRSSGRRGSFRAINIAGIDDQNFSDTLFGHKKGAFTGALENRPGLVKQAENGTLFLDEIGDLPLGSQIRLLRLLQEQEYYPLGSDQVQHSNARIIVSTNRDLQAALRSGEFRKDLYYRLATHHLHIPPLRERRDDLPLLLKHFISLADRQYERRKISQELYDFLNTYAFPGNVRELEAMINDALACSPADSLDIKVFYNHLHDESSLKNPEIFQATQFHKSQFPEGLDTNLKDFPTLSDLEARHIKTAMEMAQGKQAVAAHFLGISRQTLSKKLRSLESGPQANSKK